MGAPSGPVPARPGAARVQDVPHARPRGGVGHRLRARRAARRLGGARPDRPVRGPARRVGVDGRRRARPRSATRCGPRSTGWWPTRSPTPPRARLPRSRRHGCSPPRLRARAVGTPAGVRASDRGALRRRRPRRAARGAGRRRAGRAARPGHRRVRRRVQGHRGPGGRVRHGPGAQHADHRVGGHRRRARAGARRLPPGASRCSSATSCPAASTSSSTTSPPPTTGGARRCRWSSGCRSAAGSAPARSTRRTSRPVLPRPRAQGRRPVDAGRRQGPPPRRPRRRQPGAVSRAQGPVPQRIGRGPAGASRRAVRRGQGRRDGASTPPSSRGRRASAGPSRQPALLEADAAATSRWSTCGRCARGTAPPCSRRWDGRAGRSSSTRRP